MSILDLPNELLIHLTAHLTIDDINTLKLVNQQCLHIFSDPIIEIRWQNQIKELIEKYEKHDLVVDYLLKEKPNNYEYLLHLFCQKYNSLGISVWCKIVYHVCQTGTLSILKKAPLSVITRNPSGINQSIEFNQVNVFRYFVEHWKGPINYIKYVVQLKRLEMIDIILEKDEPNHKPYLVCLLDCCAYLKDEATMFYVLSKADDERRYSMALRSCSKNGFYQVMESIVRKGAVDNLDACLSQAIYRESWPTIRTLVSLGACPSNLSGKSLEKYQEMKKTEAYITSEWHAE